MAEITLHDDDPAVLNSVFEWIYTAEYDAANSLEEIAHHNVAIYVIADKYGISELATLAAGRVEEELSKNFNPNVFMDVASKAYAELPEQDKELKFKLMEVAIKHATPLMILCEEKVFEGDFGKAFRKELPHHIVVTKIRLRCPRCKEDRTASPTYYHGAVHCGTCNFAGFVRY